MADAVVELAWLSWVDAVVSVWVGGVDTVLADCVLLHDGGAERRVLRRESEAAIAWRSGWTAWKDLGGCGETEDAGDDKELHRRRMAA